MSADLGSDFIFPKDIDMTLLHAIFDPRLPSDDSKRLPSSNSAQKRFAAEPKRCNDDLSLKSGFGIVSDAGASSSWASRPSTVCPCLPRSRGHGMWLLSLGAVPFIG